MTERKILSLFLINFKSPQPKGQNVNWQSLTMMCYTETAPYCMRASKICVTQTYLNKFFELPNNLWCTNLVSLYIIIINIC